MAQSKVVAKAAPKTGAAPDFAGVWTNQLHSTMDLTIVGDAVSGTYTSIVSSTGQEISGPVAGWVNDDLISFVVNWPSQSLTAWTGQLVTEGGQDAIETLWHLVVNIPDADEPNGLWRTTYVGDDRFTR